MASRSKTLVKMPLPAILPCSITCLYSKRRRRTIRKTQTERKVGEVDDARYPEPQTPSQLLRGVIFGESIFYPQMRLI